MEKIEKQRNIFILCLIVLIILFISDHMTMKDKMLKVWSCADISYISIQVAKKHVDGNYIQLKDAVTELDNGGEDCFKLLFVD